MKQKIREEYKLIREKIENREEKSILITEKIKNTVEYKKAKIIAVFKSFSSEVDTNKLIEYSLNNNKIVVLPKIVEKELKFYKIQSLSDKLIRSKLGVEEPEEIEENCISKENIDLVIVPGLSFDRAKNRLGYGGGYYDRFLNDSNLKTIGVCFDKQIYEGKLPTDINDVKMDIVITEENVYI